MFLNAESHPCWPSSIGSTKCGLLMRWQIASHRFVHGMGDIMQSLDMLEFKMNVGYKLACERLLGRGLSQPPCAPAPSAAFLPAQRNTQCDHLVMHWRISLSLFADSIQGV